MGTPRRQAIIDGLDDFPPPRERPAGDLSELPEHAAFRFAPPPRRRTPGQTRRYCRDLAIAAGARLGGFSERELSRTFGVARSRVHAILKAMEPDHAGIEP